MENTTITVRDKNICYGTTEHALKSAHAALRAIANMQVQEETDKGEVLALCMAIARIELEKADGK